MMASTVPIQTNGRDFNESFLAMLTCHSCALYLSSPVYQCWDGHSFCSRCISTCLNCPKCQKNFIKSRNVSLEMITRNFLFPCKNRTEGCEAKFKLQELYQHEEVCPRQKLCECVIRKYDGRDCPWRGPCSNIWLHVKQTHPTRLLFCKNIECVVKNFDPIDIFSSVFLIRTLGESFWYYIKQDKGNKFLCAVQYIGSQHRASKYKYEIDFSSLSQTEFKLSFSRSTHPNDKKIEDIFNSEQCMSSRSTMLNNYLWEDKSLHFKFRVKPA